MSPPKNSLEVSPSAKIEVSALERMASPVVESLDSLDDPIVLRVRYRVAVDKEWRQPDHSAGTRVPPSKLPGRERVLLKPVLGESGRYGNHLGRTRRDQLLRSQLGQPLLPSVRSGSRSCTRKCASTTSI